MGIFRNVQRVQIHSVTQPASCSVYIKQPGQGLLLLLCNCNRVDTRWQQCSTHLHTNCTQNTKNGTYMTLKRKKIRKCGPCPVFASYTVEFALQLRKQHGLTSVGVIEKCPDIQVAVVQVHIYTQAVHNNTMRQNTQNGTYFSKAELTLVERYLHAATNTATTPPLRSNDLNSCQNLTRKNASTSAEEIFPIEHRVPHFMGSFSTVERSWDGFSLCVRQSN
jgi:hypothetical protein